MSRIFITGDTHGMIDWEKINTTRFPEQKNLTKNDYLIILGDFGGIWGDEGEDRYIIKTYEKRNFTTLFIDGNHENHDLLDSYPVEEWHGGKIHKISNSVFHLMRGQVFEIDGKTFFTMGGAESTDKQYRKEGQSWWVREMPSDKEYKEARKNLAQYDFKVDVVLTHCAPEGYIWEKLNPIYESDMSKIISEPMGSIVARSGNRLTRFFDSLILARHLEFKHWYFGHYHRNMDWDKFSLVYNKVRALDKEADS